MVCTRKYRDSLAKHNNGEKKVMLFDCIAFERQDFTATRAERLQNAKHWILRMNADGPQQPLRQRPEFAVALKQCRKMQETKSAIRRERKLRVPCRSDNWMAVPQRATGKPAGSVFIFKFAMTNFTMANELELMAACII